MPQLTGRAIRVLVNQSLGDQLAASSIPQRRIYLDREVLQRRGEFERILVHEIFHFVWVRLSNRMRWDWERLLLEELGQRSRGELGWSAEWRKDKLKASDRRQRSLLWRAYACESSCDSAAWMFSALRHHDEFTLAKRHRAKRRAWFEQNFATGPVPV